MANVAQCLNHNMFSLHYVVIYVVSWTTLISGYVEHGPSVKALNCFKKMQVEVRDCGNLKSSIIGQKIHIQISLARYENDRLISSECYEYN